MEKEFGQLSREQLRSIYVESFRQSTQQKELQQMLQDKGLSKYLTSWAYLYDRPFLELAGIMVVAFGWQESLEEITKLDDPQEAWLKFALDQEQEIEELELTDEERGELKDNLPFLLSLLLAIKGNFDGMRQRHRTICEMMEQVRDGNDRALFEAVSVDPTVVSCKTASDRIALAQATGEGSFFDQLSRAFKGVLPRKVNPEFNDFRFMLEVLHDAIGPKGPTVAQVEDILCQELELYEPHKDGLPKMMQKRNKSKRK